ncbi:pyrroloquinoline quinone biosynthesis protein PqqB [Streptomyces camelliae]|uniref:Coenzyme PQQ synthesis protein B n=1 Tax=Streptomyces camelliae TaxID=3004093 RepID=A0ABY7NYY4_9ACTN|nr:pyrroloquinoline quinone biosynthesis protein PqqB [Streptomyces sp. HUAS 2-6]WBO62984.1 pyrroloquinoline quinone biosynthesis protein PqqB [Streptomyces sp. HUAS 2-6]
MTARAAKGRRIDMWVRVLGSAAGGGFPQWNCACPPCRAVRDGSRPCRARTQSSIAVSPDGRRWFLFNASPDVRAQIESFPALHPTGGLGGGRAVPPQVVVLTDAELDHTLGLLLLRESGGGIELHATKAVHDTLYDGTSLLRTLVAYCPVTWHPVEPQADVPLGNGLSYRAFDVPTTKRARFGSGGGNGQGRVVGYRLTDERSGRALVYLPGVQEFTPRVHGQFADCACLLVDGTCWYDDELIRLGRAGRTAREMGHLPIDGPGGSLEQLSPLPVERKIYIHINNTNPILLEDSPQRRTLERHGMEVAADGLELRI